MIKLTVLAVTAFYTISCFFPDYWNWAVMGDESIKYVTVIIALFTTILLFNKSFCDKTHKVAQQYILAPVYNSLTRTPTILRILLWAIIPAVLLYSIKIEVHIFGDSQNMIGNMVNDNLILPIYNGICVILTLLANIFKISTRNDAQTLMEIVSIIAGPVFLFYLYNSLKVLTKPDLSRVWLFLICGISGIITLFTGYIETYPLLTAWLAVYLYHLLNTKRISIIVILFIIGIFLHFWFIAFLPSLLNIINHRNKWVSARVIFIISILFIIGTYISGQIVARNGMPLTIPIINGANTGGYTLFSGVHLLDFVNEIIITGPVLPILGIVLIIRTLISKLEFSHKQKSLLYAAVPAVLISFFIDPLMGAYRDWDLISLFTLPLMLFTSAIISSLPVERFRVSVLIPILLITSVHTFGFIYLNKNENISVDKAIQVALKDPHYQGDYHEGKRNKTFASIVGNIFDRPKDAIEFAKRRTNIKSANYNDIIFLANSYFNVGDFENAQYYWSLIHDYNLLTTINKTYYGVALSLTDRHYKAIEVLKSAINQTINYDLLLFMSNSYAYTHQIDSCKKYFDYALEYSQDPVATLNNIVDILSKAKEYKTAIEYLHRLMIDSPNAQGLQQKLKELQHKQKLLESYLPQ